MRTFKSAARPMVAALLTGSLLLSSACGLIITQPPPPDHRSLAYFSCTESTAGPVIDIVWGGLNVLGGLLATSDPSSPFYNVNPEQTRSVGLAWGVLSGVSAAVGFGKVKRCREAKRELAERQSLGAGVSPAPQTTATVAVVVVAPAADTLRVGGQLQFIATARGSSGLPVADPVFTWTSSNDAVASVSVAGLVTAHAPGAITIAARTGFVVGTASVTVLPR